MQSSKGHKLFTLVMLILIVGGALGFFISGAISVYEYRQEQKQQEAITEAYNEIASSQTSEEE